MDQPDGTFGPLIASRLRVLTWNLWGRFGPWRERQARIEKTLARIDADLIGLQEVWAEPDRTFADVLAEKLGLHAVYASRLDVEGIHLGVAILSRWPIVSHEHRPLPAAGAPDERRLALRADVDGPRGPLQIFTTHLNWRFDHSHVRQAQVAVLADFVRSSPKRTYPPILCGDLNATPTSDEIRMLTGRVAVPNPPLVFHDAWEAAGDGTPGYTWSNENPFAARDLEPNRRIDYVLVGWPKGGGAGHVVSSRVEGAAAVDGLHASDHAAVLAELRY